MQLYTVLSSIILCSVVVWTAPLAENEIELAKRAKETIMYGNQQNSPRRVKKNDPSLTKDVSNDADLKGHVIAMPARDVPADAVKEDNLPPTDVESDASTEVQASDSNIPLKPDTEDNKSDVTESPTEDIDPDVQDMLQSDSMVNSEEDADDEPVEDSVNVPALPGQNEDQLANWYHYLLQYGKNII
ncbi:hypothetical protein LOTGIDRAFT_239738 [Lottia gigantea]|uniref:Uncharacterized protein n=1 Tax=Lottia gigantea TaxID=225164 RepID=V4AQY3_LOTGI|nr:hypothetical protein LOTGIDRAFT_239738 [Lottia gigantea]ESO99657.1 hypothetical protein LOTGIDRAFT_239738 [Lottia gigantea]